MAELLGAGGVDLEVLELTVTVQAGGCGGGRGGGAGGDADDSGVTDGEAGGVGGYGVVGVGVAELLGAEGVDFVDLG